MTTSTGLENDFQNRIDRFLRSRRVKRVVLDDSRSNFVDFLNTNVAESYREASGDNEHNDESNEGQSQNYLEVYGEETPFSAPIWTFTIDDRIQSFLGLRFRRRSSNINDYYLSQYSSDSEESINGVIGISGDSISDRYVTIETDLETDEELCSGEIKPENLVRHIPLDSETAHEHWESNTQITDRISFKEGEERSDDDDLEGFIWKLPGKKFQDALDVRLVGRKRLNGLDDVYEYRNNLTVLFQHSNGSTYLVSCAGSKLKVFDLDLLTHLPSSNPCMVFESMPNFTTNEDTMASTYPIFPHNINFLRTGTFLEQEVLAACIDDGRVLIWNLSNIVDAIEQSRQRFVNTDAHFDNGIKILPDYKLQLQFSAWGLDFLSYVASGKRHDLICTSDNGQIITVFYYFNGNFEKVESHKIAHNIPEVSFIDYNVVNSKHEITLSCVDIGGELLVFRVKFMLDSSQNSSISSVLFSTPQVIFRTLLLEEGWSVKSISTNFFKKVNSVFELTGDETIPQNEYIRTVLKESAELDAVYDPVKTSHLGVAAKYQYLFCPSVSIRNIPHVISNEDKKRAKIQNIDDEYRRIYRDFKKDFFRINLHHKKEASFNGYKYWPMPQNISRKLVVSTSKRLALFDAGNLFCNASTNPVFDDCINPEGEAINRISITELIPELSCYIAASQQGFLSIFRLVHYRGLYSFREEYVFPDKAALALGNGRSISVTGLTVRNLSFSSIQRFIIYITYSSGLIFVYEISEGKGNNIDISSF